VVKGPEGGSVPLVGSANGVRVRLNSFIHLTFVHLAITRYAPSARASRPTDYAAVIRF
jgi:hypothetical protein